jgi:hypothetical protein
MRLKKRGKIKLNHIYILEETELICNCTIGLVRFSIFQFSIYYILMLGRIIKDISLKMQIETMTPINAPEKEKKKFLIIFLSLKNL